MPGLLVVLYATLATLVSAGGGAPLNDAGLHVAFSGKTHLSTYRRYVESYGGVYFEETYHRDGTLSYQSGNVFAQGQWKIKNSTICFDYLEPFMVSACFKVVYNDGCYYSYEVDPTTGVVLGFETGTWWIRSYIKGTDPACAHEGLISQKNAPAKRGVFQKSGASFKFWYATFFLFAIKPQRRRFLPAGRVRHSRGPIPFRCSVRLALRPPISCAACR